MPYSLNLFGHVIPFQSYNGLVPFLQVGNVTIFFIALITAFVLLTLIFSKREKQIELGSIMNVENTDRMRGIAILLIIFHHIGYHLLGITDTSFSVLGWGAVGVSIFLFLSGFGIYKSYEKKGIDNIWYIKRYIRVWVPYVLVSVVWLFLDPRLLGIQHSRLDTFLTLSGLSFRQSWAVVDYNMWFIPFILFMYAIFFVVYKRKNISNLVKFAIFTIISTGAILAENVAMHHTGHISEIWGFDYALFFPLGILLGMYYSKIEAYLNNIRNKRVIFYGTIVVIIFALLQSIFLNTNTLWEVIFFIASLFLLLQFRIKSNFLYWIGVISYEIYLLHGPLMYRYDFLMFHKPFWLFISIYFIVLFTLAFLLWKVSGVIVGYLNILLNIKWKDIWNRLSSALYNYQDQAR